MPESTEKRFEGRVQSLNQKDLVSIRKEWKPRARSSTYRDFLNTFLEGSNPALKIEHVSVGEQAGFMGLIYPPKKGGEAPFKGKVFIQTRTEEGKDPKGKKLYTILLTKSKPKD
jgi:hypothetical protein